MQRLPPATYTGVVFTDEEDQDRLHRDWIVSKDDVRSWHKAHPGTIAGFDIAPIILNERLATAAQQLRASHPGVPDVLLDDQLRLLWQERQSKDTSRRSMIEGLADRVAAYTTGPRTPDLTAPDAVTGDHLMGDESSVPDPQLAPRRPGRPSWPRTLFLERLREAASAASMDEDGRRRRLGREPALPDIAVVFRALDGQRGISPEHLRRLRRRFVSGS